MNITEKTMTDDLSDDPRETGEDTASEAERRQDVSSAPEEAGGAGVSPQDLGGDEFPEEMGEGEAAVGSPTEEASAASDGSSASSSGHADSQAFSGYEEERSTLAALPALRVEESVQVWEPPSPTAWRMSAFKYAGSALLGAAVTLGAVAATVGLTPKKASNEPMRDIIVQAAPPQPPMNGMIPGVQGDPNMPIPPLTPNGEGTALPQATPNDMPNVPPGTGVPTPAPTPPTGGGARNAGPLPGGLIPPMPKGLTLPPLTDAPPRINPASGLPTLPPGMMPPGGSTRPPLNMAQPTLPANTVPGGKANPNAKTAPKPRVPTAPPVRSGAPAPRTPVAAATPPGVRAAVSEEDLDDSIANAKRAASTNPKDASAHYQLERLYRKKLIQAERVDEMEHFRALADEARDKARAAQSGGESGKAAPKPAPAPSATPPAAQPEAKSEDNSQSKTTGEDNSQSKAETSSTSG